MLAAMHGRLLLLQHRSEQQLQAWRHRLGDQWVSAMVPGLCLLARGAPIRESADNRALGARTGVLFNLTEQRQRLLDRGLASTRLDGDGVCVEAIAAGGPPALAGLARHGLVAIVHRAQGQALVASDAQGLAPLFAYQPEQGGWIVGGDRAAITCATGAVLPRRDDDLSTVVGAKTGVNGLWRVPAGVAVLLSAQGLQASAWRVAADVGPFLRTRPPAHVQRDRTAMQAHLDAAVATAIAAWAEDRGALPWPSGDHAALLAAFAAAAGLSAAVDGSPAGDGSPTSSATHWPSLGLDALLAEFGHAMAPLELSLTSGLDADALALAFAEANAGGPFQRISLPEPEARLQPVRRRARWFRHTFWRCCTLEKAIERAAAANQAIGLPHLSPGVVASVGAWPDDLAPWRV